MIYEIIHAGGQRHLMMWLGSDAVDYENWRLKGDVEESPHMVLTKPDATTVLEGKDVNELVIAWLRGPIGPVGPMGPPGFSG